MAHSISSSKRIVLGGFPRYAAPAPPRIILDFSDGSLPVPVRLADDEPGRMFPLLLFGAVQGRLSDDPVELGKWVRSHRSLKVIFRSFFGTGGKHIASQQYSFLSFKAVDFVTAAPRVNYAVVDYAPGLSSYALRTVAVRDIPSLPIRSLFIAFGNNEQTEQSIATTLRDDSSAAVQSIQGSVLTENVSIV